MPSVTLLYQVLLVTGLALYELCLYMVEKPCFLAYEGGESPVTSVHGKIEVTDESKCSKIFRFRVLTPWGIKLLLKGTPTLRTTEEIPESPVSIYNFLCFKNLLPAGVVVHIFNSSTLR